MSRRVRSSACSLYGFSLVLNLPSVLPFNQKWGFTDIAEFSFIITNKRAHFEPHVHCTLPRALDPLYRKAHLKSTKAHRWI